MTHTTRFQTPLAAATTTLQEPTTLAAAALPAMQTKRFHARRRTQAQVAFHGALSASVVAGQARLKRRNSAANSLAVYLRRCSEKKGLRRGVRPGRQASFGL